MAEVFLRKLKFEWLAFVSALQLLTRLPLEALVAQDRPEAAHHQRAQIWYPWAGLIIGLLLAMLTSFLPEQWSVQLCGALILIVWIGLTGSLHLDGLADAADAWAGGMADREKTLSIMKDPTCGPAAVVVICLCLLLKWQLLAELLGKGAGSIELSLVLAPLAARAWLLPMLASLPYARQDAESGMAANIAREFPIKAGVTSFVAAQIFILLFLLAAGLGLFSWIGVMAIMTLVFWSVWRATRLRLGGYTGDVLGALVELMELTFLVSLVVFLG